MVHITGTLTQINKVESRKWGFRFKRDLGDRMNTLW